MNQLSRIAIVGIGGVFPASPTLDDFWSHIASGTCVAREVPLGRWLLKPDDAFDPHVGSIDHVYSRRGCFIEGFQLDPQGLNLDASWLNVLDPMFHLALHASHQALRDAVTETLDFKRVGVVFGNIVLPTEKASELARAVLGRAIEEKLFGDRTDSLTIDPWNRYVAGLPAGIVAKALGLGGGSYTLDAACASSLYALKLACDQLQSGRRDAMLTGGLSRPDCLYTQMGFAQLRALSARGLPAPFDQSADGLVVGEGAGMFLLKRLNDAIRQGDHIYGVITGIGLSNDRHGRLLAPSSEGQLRAMRAAYQLAGWTPQDVDLIECHATGTPVGDAVEFESLRSLWGKEHARPGPCVIGSVKSNVGHTLTAAGSAGLLKVLLALQHQKLPPTANFSAAADKLDFQTSPFRVLTKQEKWEPRATGAGNETVRRRAAVSAFGFGGINAHVLIEEWKPETTRTLRDVQANIASSASLDSVAARRNADHAPIAIVGMGAHFGRWQGLAAFRERVLGDGEGVRFPSAQHCRGMEESNCHVQSGLPHSLHGNFIEKLTVPLDRFRIPPRELEEMLPQQLLMLLVAAEAIDDCRFLEERLLRTGVFIGLGLDLNTTNFHVRWSLLNRAREWNRQFSWNLDDAALQGWVQRLRNACSPPLTANRTMGALGGIVASRIAREFHIGGPSFTVSNEEGSGMRAFELGVESLRQGQIDQAIVGAVDLPSDVRAAIATHVGRPFSPANQVFPFDDRAEGTLPADGAAAVILKRLDDAIQDGDRVYAVVRGVGNASGHGAQSFVPDPSAYQTALAEACNDAGIDASSIGYLELNGSGYAPEDDMELRAIDEFFEGPPRAVTCALGSVKADILHAGAAAGLASLVKTALCLHHLRLPSLRNVVQLKEKTLSQNLCFPSGPQYWLRDRADGPRRAAVGSLSVDENCHHAILEEFEASPPALTFQRSNASREALFVLEADNAQELKELLGRLSDFANSNPGLQFNSLAHQWWKEHPLQPKRKLGLAIVVRTQEELEKRIGRAQLILRSSKNESSSASTSLRSHRDNSIGDVFFEPNPVGHDGRLAFVFPGSGNHFPGMGRELSAEWPDILRQLDVENQHLRSQMLPEFFWNLASLDGIRDHRTLIFGQVTLGAMVSDLVRSFGVEPHAVIGYSLGETAGLFALRAWTARDEMLQRMMTSNLFTHELAGPCEAAQRSWELANGESVDWLAGVVDVSADVVREYIGKRQRLYLLIINTPAESIVGGQRQAVEALIRDLRCRFYPLQGVSTVHCPIAAEVERAYRSLHLFPTTPPSGVRFYSGAWGKAFELDQESAADSITAQAIHGIDFPALVRQAWDDGVRHFVEIGPGASCTRMIHQILADRAHFAQSACVAGEDQVSTILHLLAGLVAQRVPVDLSRLYVDREPSTVASQKTNQLVIEVGGGPFNLPPLPAVEAVAPALAASDKSDAVREGLETRPHQLVSPAPGPAAMIAAQTPINSTSNRILQQFSATQAAKAEAHAAHLRLSQHLTGVVAQQMSLLTALLQKGLDSQEEIQLFPRDQTQSEEYDSPPTKVSPQFDRTLCLEFAVGSIARMLGPEFAVIDSFPTRVRLPDEPLMLVDRILSVEGEPRSLSSGRVVTEHDVREGAWYLDGGRIPTCIAVEAGQADLFLSGYLGIDFHTRGQAVYRLLDAVVTFHRGLPVAGEVIHYDIRIERFFRQGDTHLFRFSFESTVNGEPLLTMKEGCAGFFSEAELNAGKGIIHTELDRRPRAGIRPGDWQDFVPMGVESFSAAQVEALRNGELEAAFGSLFSGLPLQDPVRLPAGRMKLVHRVLRLDPLGGRYGLGLVRAEADIHPDDWFLTCHFVDDQVMPGTLMYECCLHTLRIFLLRMGWIGEHNDVAHEPVPDVPGRLKCRGQVIASTRVVTYEVSIKELGYRPEPFAIVDALMFADGKPIVEITDMSLRMTGLTRERIEAIWAGKKVLAQPNTSSKAPLFNYDRILAFAVGKPSVAFGEPYKVFDDTRVIARLPGPPYQFLDRIVSIHAEPWKMVSGGEIVAEYDVPADAWYFEANRQSTMPFAVLLEVALQPCGWLAAYLGSALTSPVDMSFRNLGGIATQFAAVTPASGKLSTTVKITKVSSSGGMIIQNYEFAVHRQAELIYQGDTYFGFFTKQALAQQVGVREAEWYKPSTKELSQARSFPYPEIGPFPDDRLRMIDKIDALILDGGPKQSGFIEGSKGVDPAAWFFKAHFYQDPVVPGSLGLESFLQLLKAFAREYFDPEPTEEFETVALGERHRWVYRGQVIPNHQRVAVQAVITACDRDKRFIRADGLLSVDGRVIYQMHDFTLRLTR